MNHDGSGPASPYISPFADHCQGARDPNRYVIAFVVAAAKTPLRFGHPGSDHLDRINAFDLAEIATASVGQINLIEVSSFCGKEGLIWGHDIVRSASASSPAFWELPQWDGANVPVRDGEPLVTAATELFGTIDRPRFPIAPGSHTPCATKNVTTRGPATIYAACGVGIRHPEDAASILMEDVGRIIDGVPLDQAIVDIRRAVAESVLAVAENQRVRCKEILVAIRTIRVEEGEMGCAISLVPYLSLASRAAPEGAEALRSVPLDEWVRAVGR